MAPKKVTNVEKPTEGDHNDYGRNEKKTHHEVGNGYNCIGPGHSIRYC